MMFATAMWYNMTDINATSVLTFVQGVNRVFMFNQLGILILVVLWLISFMSMNYYMPLRTVNNFTVTSLFIAIISMLLSINQLVHWSVPLTCFGMFVFGVIGLLLRK